MKVKKILYICIAFVLCLSMSFTCMHVNATSVPEVTEDSPQTSEEKKEESTKGKKEKASEKNTEEKSEEASEKNTEEKSEEASEKSTEEKTEEASDKYMEENSEVASGQGSENSTEEKTEDAGEGGAFDNELLIIGLIAAGCVIVILVAVILIMSITHKKGSSEEGGGIPAEKEKPANKRKTSAMKDPKTVPAGKALNIEVISGRYMVSGKEYSFTDELLIGSGDQNDILFIDPDVAETHAKIQIKNGLMYLIDLSGGMGTYLEDMRIQDSNPLESGDAVMIGSAEFRVYF